MPGPNVAYRYSALNTETTKFLTYIILVFNVVFTVLGAMMFAMSIYMLLEPDFRRWIIDLELQHYWTGVYVLLGAAVITMLQTFFGIVGAYQKKTTMLFVFSICVFVCIILEITGSAILLNNGIRFSKIEDWLRVKFLALIADYNYNDNSKRTMSIIQEWVGCCGADGVYDYIRWNKVIPSTCYDPVNGNAWYKKNYGYVGCVRGFTFYIESMTGWVCGLALVLAFLQIFALIAAVLLACLKKDFKSKSNLNLNR